MEQKFLSSMLKIPILMVKHGKTSIFHDEIPGFYGYFSFIRHI
jgi:hypothetical protein